MSEGRVKDVFLHRDEGNQFPSGDDISPLKYAVSYPTRPELALYHVREKNA
jgi:hypothetical protein